MAMGVDPSDYLHADPIERGIWDDAIRSAQETLLMLYEAQANSIVNAIGKAMK